MGFFRKGPSANPVGRKGQVINLDDLSSDDFVSDDIDEPVMDGPPEDQGDEVPSPTVDDFLKRVHTDGYAGKGAEIAEDFLDILVQHHQENPGSTVSELVGYAAGASKFSADAPHTISLMELLAMNLLLDAAESGESGPTPYQRMKSLLAAIEEKELGVSLI